MFSAFRVWLLQSNCKYSKTACKHSQRWALQLLFLGLPALARDTRRVSGAGGQPDGAILGQAEAPCTGASWVALHAELPLQSR